jgi:hypothetical protein
MESRGTSSNEKNCHNGGLIVGVFQATLLILAVTAFVLWYLPAHYKPRPVAGNTHWGPAVSFAFGEGFKNPLAPFGSKLYGFLNHSDPKELKYNDVMHPMPAEPMTAFQRHHTYLLVLIGVCWWLFGVSWINVAPLVALMAAVSSICIYGILRLRVRPWIAFVGACALFACPAQLALLHYVRDYSKTPLFLASFFLIAILLTRQLTTKGLLVIGVAIGFVTGFGYGIRQDIAVIWAIIPLIYLFFLPTGLSRKLGVRIASLCIAVALFFAISRPAMSARDTMGNTTAHSLVMGLFRYNHDTMGLGGAPYVWLNESLMTDSDVNTIIQDYNRRLVGERVVVDGLGLKYERAGQAFFLNLVKHFPADFISRFVAASLTTISDSPWLIVGARDTIYDISDPFIEQLQGYERPVRLYWNQYGTLLVCIALIILSWHSIRLALAVTGVLVFFTGYTSLQFQPRHFWHLGVVFICVPAFLLEEFLRLVRLSVDGQASLARAFSKQRAKAGCKRIVTFTSVLIAGFVAVFGTARLYQSKAVKNLYGQYQRVAKIPAAGLTVEDKGGQTRVLHATREAAGGEGDIRSRYDYEYIGVRFEGIGALPESLTPLHENIGPIFVKQMISGSQGPTTVFFPMTPRGKTFDIEVKGGDPASAISVFSVANPDVFPNPMVLVLPDKASSLPTHNFLIKPKRAR